MSSLIYFVIFDFKYDFTMYGLCYISNFMNFSASLMMVSMLNMTYNSKKYILNSKKQFIYFEVQNNIDSQIKRYYY